MSVDYGKVFGKAFGYSLSANRMLPFFIINLVIVTMLFLFVDSLATFISYSSGFNTGISTIPFATQTALAGLVSTIFIFFVVILVLSLVRLFFTGAITDNARLSWGKKEKPISASFGIAKKKYWSMLGATIVAVLIGFAVGLIPYVGWIFAIIISWMLLLIIPAVIISNKRAIDSLKESYNIFMKNKFEVFLFWLLLLIIGFVIILIVIIPIVIIMLPFVLTASFAGAMSSTGFLTFLKGNMLYLFVGGILASIVLAYLNVFQDAAKTFFYLSIKKGKK